MSRDENIPLNRSSATVRHDAGDVRRAMSSRSALAPEPSGMAGQRALPLPPRDLDADEVAKSRGEADALALQLRHHDAKTHAKRRPAVSRRGPIFDAVEQARVEAIGAQRMMGVSENLESRIDDRCRQGPAPDPTG